MSDKEFFDRAMIAFAAAFSSTNIWTEEGVINKTRRQARVLLAERNKALQELKLND